MGIFVLLKEGDMIYGCRAEYVQKSTGRPDLQPV